VALHLQQNGMLPMPTDPQIDASRLLALPSTDLSMNPLPEKPDCDVWLAALFTTPVVT